MSSYGYVRISSTDQNKDRQMIEMEMAGTGDHKRYQHSCRKSSVKVIVN